MTSRRTRIAALGAAMALVGLPLAGPTALAAPVTTAADEEAPLVVRVATLLPRAPAPGQAFEVTGTVTNTGSSAAAAVRVQLRIGDKVTTRSGLHEADRDRPPTYLRLNTFVATATPDLAPGQSSAFDLRTTVDRLGLGGVGVYPLDVEATADYGDAGRTRLGTAATWVPWMAGERVAPTRIAVVLPLVDEPRRGPDDVLLDDTLAGTVATTGRLGRLLAVGTAAARGECEGVPLFRVGTPVPPPVKTVTRARCDATPVTFAVEPDLLQTVKGMTVPYSVHPPSQPARPGTGTPAATAWLQGLVTAAGSSPVLALPFADPDVAALSPDVRGRYEVGLSRSLGVQIATELLGHAPISSAAWPPAGPFPPIAQEALATDGTDAMVLDQSAFSAGPADSDLTPDAHTPLPPSNGSPLTGLVPDPVLSDLITGRTAAADGPRLAEQRYIAETAIIAAEKPSVSRTLLVVPDRRGDVAVAAATESLRDAGRLPWLCSVPLSEVARSTEQCSGVQDGAVAKPAQRGALRLDTTGQLAPAFLAGIVQDRDTAAQFTDQVLDPLDNRAEATKQRLRRAGARAESSAWRTDRDGGRREARLLSESVSALVGGLTVHGAPLLLTSAKGTLSVSVDNALDVPVRCAVVFTSTAGAVIDSPQTTLRTIPARHSAQLSVQAQARTSGGFVVVAQLVDRQGQPFGAVARVTVRSTRYGRLALAVTGLGAGVLLVAAGVRIARRAVRSRSRSAT